MRSSDRLTVAVVVPSNALSLPVAVTVSVAGVMLAAVVVVVFEV